MKRLFKILVLSSFTFFLLGGCSAHNGSMEKQGIAPITPLGCVVVLPAGTSVDKDETINFEKAQSLEKGATYATRVITDYLGGNTRVRMLTSDQITSLIPGVSGGLSGTVSAIGRKLNCDGVLTTTIQRFRQRKGTEYASDSPASVHFKMTLIHAGSGKVLWARDYRETQKSFFSDLFSISKVQKRGIKWVSAEQLAEQALQERLAECPYLK